jgi:hypothetical protein
MNKILRRKKNMDEYAWIEHLWDKALTSEQQKDALDKAQVYCKSLNMVDWYSKKLALQAIGMID